LQILSDLRTGGVAFWLDEAEVLPGKQIIRRQFFAGMPALYEFINNALKAVPAAMLGRHRSGRPMNARQITLCSQKMRDPGRRKLTDPGLRSREARLDVIKTCFAALNEEDTADADAALAAWYPNGGDQPLHYPDHPSPQPCPLYIS
jgi:hypothetical protein